MALVGLKQTFYRGANGGAAYPNLRQIPESLRGGMLPDHYVKQWSDWRYNKANNLGNGADHGERVAIVEEDFAKAVMAIPELSSQHEVLDENAVADFWNNKHAVETEDEIVDESALKKLEVRHNLMVARGVSTDGLKKINQKIDKALDPEDTEPGIKKNMQKTWARFKGLRKLQLKQ